MGEMKPAHIPPSISYVAVARQIKLSPFLFALFVFLLLFAYDLYAQGLTQLVGQFSFSRIDAKQPDLITFGQSDMPYISIYYKQKFL
jgi:hypothetical protein